MAALLTDELAAIEATAVRVASAAGELALAAFRSTITLEFKGRKQDDPVTAADRDIETFLRTELRRAFPHHGLLGEEHADDIAEGAEYVWALDPLDGTANFASGLPLWGVSMGLLHKGVPVVGCIWVPVGPDLGPGVFHARAGGGAWFDDQRLMLADEADQRGRILALPGQYWRTFRFRRPEAGAPRTRRTSVDPRSLGSIAAELVLVAAGTLRLCLFVQPKIWDVAAGVLIAREAGARVLGWRSGGWHDFAAFEPVPEPRKKDPGPPALRHWSRPLVVGQPAMAGQVAERLVWQPRLPRSLRKLLGLPGA